MPGLTTAIKTRFAPSPTGFLHLGGARTALYAWLFARHMGGEFILRIEDTDIERSTQSAIDAILDGLKWLGLDWDRGPYYQTQHFERYRAVLQQMLAVGSAYKCYCSKERLNTLREQQRLQGQKPRYDGHCRDKAPALVDASTPYVIRFRNPQQGVVSFEDQVRGWISIENAELDDLILCRSDQTPTYNFCVVVDDWDMGITHVIRGEDHINNTPRQINLLRALGAPIPYYAHLSMILGADGQKLSKRHGAVSVLHYRDQGYLPQALLNYLLRLGWSHGDQEIFSVPEMQQLFSLAAIHSAASLFNQDKLLWLNHHYINHLDPKTVLQHLQWQLQQQSIDICNGPPLLTLLQLLGPRYKTLTALAQASHYFFQDDLMVDEQDAQQYLTLNVHPALSMVYTELAALSQWTAQAIHQVIQQVASSLTIPISQVGMPLRVAVTGSRHSPSIDATLQAIGQARTLARIRQAVDRLAQQAAHSG